MIWNMKWLGWVRSASSFVNNMYGVIVDWDDDWMGVRCGVIIMNGRAGDVDSLN